MPDKPYPPTLSITFKSGAKSQMYMVTREVNEKMASDMKSNANAVQSYEVQNTNGEPIIIAFLPYDVLYIG
jgi:uncharacterized radical SAM superfamily Fe-S cluster-containing enzyme